jgi:hypothetical protein
MWQCDYCESINEYNLTNKIITCQNCKNMNNFLTRWVNAKTLVIGANYSQYDYEFWSQIDINYIGIGDDYDRHNVNKTIFQNDWTSIGFWEQSVLPKQFYNIFIDYSVIFTFSRDIPLFRKLFQFIQRHSKSSTKLYFLYDDFNTIMYSYMSQKFIENLNPQHKYPYKSVSGNKQTDIELLNIIIESGDWVVYDDIYEIKTQLEHKKKWKGLYKVK